MSHLSRSAAVAVGLILGFGCVHRGPPSSSVLVGSQVPLSVIPFELYNGHIAIPVYINGDSTTLIFDTGSRRTILDREWALSAGAVPTSVNEQTREVTAVRVGSFVWGGVRLQDSLIGVLALDSVDRGTGRWISGLLGNDVLRRFTVEIDPETSEIRLFDPLRYRYVGSGVVVPLEFDNGDFLVQAKVRFDDHHTASARLILDTGASRLCLIVSRRFLKAHAAQLMSAPGISNVVGVGVRGPFMGRIIRIPQLRVGGFAANTPTVGLPDGRADSVLRLPADGVIGDGILGRTGLVFDFARRRMIFRTPVTAPDQCAYDRSGVFLMASGPRLDVIRVENVVPGSPASEAGVRLGDEILAIDGQATSPRRLGALRDSLALHDAIRILTLRRGNDTLSVTVGLHSLF